MLLWSLVLSLLTGSVFAEDEPFWKVKDKVYSRIENREVIVSVTSAENRGRGHRLSLKGGGQINAPCAFAEEDAKDFEGLAKASSYVDKAHFDQGSNQMDLSLSAYGLSAEVSFKILPKDHQIHYVMTRGPLSGLEGDVVFFEAKKNRCDIGLDGFYVYETFPIPQFFLKFGLEVVLQRMAYAIREKVEEDFKKKGEVK